MKSKELRKLIDKGVKNLTDALAAGESDKLKAFLKMAARFHKYSLNNLHLIYSQCPDATRVCGYKTWQKFGRQVVKGEKSIKILAPHRYKAKDDNGDHTDIELMYFTAVSVFDISQTEGDDLPGVFNVNGNPGEYLNILEDLIQDLGIGLVNEDHLEGALGKSCGGTIKVLNSLDKAERFTTLAHELAHELLHRSKDRDSLNNRQKETEAEAVSYVVGQSIGVDSLGQAADYIQLWKGDLDLFTQHLDRIQKCAKQIIKGLTKKSTVLIMA